MVSVIYIEKKNRTGYWKTYYHTYKKEYKEYAKNHKEIIKKAIKKYHLSTKGIYSMLKTNANRRGIDFSINSNDFMCWYNSQIKVCSYCDIPETKLCSLGMVHGFNSYRLSIDRINNKLGYKIENICLACSHCNSIKN